MNKYYSESQKLELVFRYISGESIKFISITRSPKFFRHLKAEGLYITS